MNHYFHYDFMMLNDGLVNNPPLQRATARKWWVIEFEDLYTEENIPWDSDDNRITKEMLENVYQYSDL